jgi:hypothetical protein
LSLARVDVRGVTDKNNYGWFSGNISSVDRIDFADDTATALVRGTLSLARTQLASVSGAGTS